MQVPGEQGPFGPILWLNTFGEAAGVPGLARVSQDEFLVAPTLDDASDWPTAGVVAYHCRAARIPWATINEDNYRDRIGEAVPKPAAAAITAVLDRALACTGGG